MSPLIMISIIIAHIYLLETAFEYFTHINLFINIHPMK